MAYWLDDGWDSWPEVVRAGTPAAGLYARCGSWIARNLTDGLVPLEVARMYGTAEWITRLVDVSLWAIEETGYRDLRYFPMNPSAEKVRKRRQDAADRQRRLRDRRHGKPTGESRVTHGGSHSSPAPPSTKGEGARPAPHPFVGEGMCCNLPEKHLVHRTHLRAVEAG
jgi:hypothetical protein